VSPTRNAGRKGVLVAGLFGEEKVSQSPVGVNTKKELSLWVFLKDSFCTSIDIHKLWISYEYVGSSK
jgi:hypothetical protein